MPIPEMGQSGRTSMTAEILPEDAFGHGEWISPSSRLGHADKSMLDFAAEQKGHSVGIHPPHERPNAERRPLRRN